MKIRRKVSTRFDGELRVTDVDRQDDAVIISREFAACKTCGYILPVNEIRMCYGCRSFLCEDCRIKFNSYILCRDCLHRFAPLDLHEYLILRYIEYFRGLSLYELVSLTAIPPHLLLILLNILMEKGLVIRSGFIFKKYFITVQGHYVCNVYRRIYEDPFLDTDYV